MDDATAGNRLKTLQAEITQLKARAAELADTISTEPAMPPPGTIETLQQYLTDVITSGTSAERKAARHLSPRSASLRKESSPCFLIVAGQRPRRRHRPHRPRSHRQARPDGGRESRPGIPGVPRGSVQVRWQAANARSCRDQS